MLTFAPGTPSPYTCTVCGITACQPVPAFDADGRPLLDGHDAQVVVNDEPAAAAELADHLATHPAPAP